MADCTCPLPTALPDMPDNACPFDVKQIQRLVVIREGNVIWDSESGGGDGLSGVPQIDSQVDTKADWEALKIAADDTKAVFTPLLGGDPVIEAGEPITSGGGDNSTLNGETEYNGENPSVLTAVFKSVSPEQHKALREIFNCNNVEVYLINQNGTIFCIQIEDGETRRGIRCTGFVGERGNQGYATKDTVAITLNLEANWSENLRGVTPEAGFDPIRGI